MVRKGEPDWDLAAQPDEVDQRVGDPVKRRYPIAAGKQLRARQAKCILPLPSSCHWAAKRALNLPWPERVSRPKTRAILGLMRLNFLSVWRAQIYAVRKV